MDEFNSMLAAQEPEALDRMLRKISQDTYARFDKEARDARARYNLPDCPSLYTPNQWVEPLRAFLRDNSGKTPEELQDMASALAPGSVHNNCDVFYAAMNAIFSPCPYLRAAFLAWTWGGGKIGFQHLPDPRRTDLDDYQFLAEQLMEWLSEVRPTDVLTGEDRAFYDALPDRFRVYRGGSSVEPEMVAAVLCWTLKRDIADWFARRGQADPVVVSAWVRKEWVRLAFAQEHEVVVQPWRWRQVAYRHRVNEKWRPAFGWTASVDVSAAGTGAAVVTL
jgi:hypothetical protein